MLETENLREGSISPLTALERMQLHLLKFQAFILLYSPNLTTFVMGVNAVHRITYSHD